MAEQSWPLSFGERPELRFSAKYGRVTITPVASGEEPRLTASGDLDRLRVGVHDDGPRVSVEVDQEFEWFTWRREAWDLRFALALPKGIRVAVRTNAGTIDVRGLRAEELEVRSDAGRVTLEEVSGRLRVVTQAGEVVGRGLAGTLNVETQAGRLDLEVERLEAGEHRVSAEVGAIHLRLAPDVQVHVETRTSIGSVRDVFPSSRDADAVLRVSTTVGAVTVEPSR